MTSPQKNRLMLGGNIFGYFLNFNETKSIINHARELKILAIDTADVYSEGISEEWIGKCIKQDRSKWFIASKVGLRSHALKEGLGSRKSILKKVEGSLKRLQTDYIDLYQMHHFDPITPLSETIETFEELLNQGKILSAGISNYDLNQLNAIKSYGKNNFKFHQMSLNITNFSLVKESLEHCEKENISVLAYACLARGLLNEKYLTNKIPENSRAAISANVFSDLTPNFLHRLSLTHNFAIAHGLSLLQIALHWINNQRAVDKLIIGFRSIEQLQSVHRLFLSDFPRELLKNFELIWFGFKNR